MRIVPILAAALVLALSPSVRTMEKPGGYPGRPVEIIVPSPAGGGLDVAARLLAKYAQTELGQTIRIRNQTRGGNIGGKVEAVRAAPDGYVLGAWTCGLATDELLFADLPYTRADIRPLGLFASDVHLVVIGADYAGRFGIRTLADLFEHARTRPGLVTIGVGGNWTTHDFLRLKIEQGAGLRFNRMPFLGGSLSARAVAEGNCHVAVPSVPEVLPWLGSDRILVLAAASQERLPLLPEVATVAEAGFPGMTQEAWRVLALPAGADGEIASYLEWVFRNAAQNPGFRDEAGLAGIEPLFLDAEEAREFIEIEHRRYAEALREWGVLRP